MLRDGIRDKWLIVNEIYKRVKLEYPEEVVGGTLEGKSFCSTGTLSRKRKEIYADITANGGEIKSGVSKTLDYLITGDSTGSKLDKAKKLGVTIINEDQLMEMINKGEK
jgi:DNA ligase (NAD+)